MSLLPLRGIYLFTDVAFVIMYFLLPYRKHVVMQNLRKSFPQKSEKEIKQIAKKFYRHFTDLIAESIRIFSMPEKEVLKRFQLINPELLNKYYEEGRSLIITGGHYNNWELLAVGINQQLLHQIAGIYTPIRSTFFNNKFLKTRSRGGLIMVPKKEVKKFFIDNADKLTATIFGADQCPSAHSKNFYRTTFLHQDTAVMFGTEKFAVEYNYPVIFMQIHKVKRGYYTGEAILIEENPKTSSYGSITEQHTKLLEQQINTLPQYWLWTHKRWKLKLPPVAPQ